MVPSPRSNDVRLENVKIKVPLERWTVRRRRRHIGCGSSAVCVYMSMVSSTAFTPTVPGPPGFVNVGQHAKNHLLTPSDFSSVINKSHHYENNSSFTSLIV